MLAAALALALAGAPTVSEAPEATRVVIYRGGPRDGLAFVTETRRIEIPAGRSRVAFRGVAPTLVPQTASVEGVDGRLVEQNFDYDLLSPGSLLEAHVGRTVQIQRTDPASGATTLEEAVVRSGPHGPVLELSGGVEALRCSGLPEKLIFSGVPAGLSDRPTLSVVVDSPQAGPREIQLSYLAAGFDWQADYVAKIRPDGRRLDLTGWITLENATSATFVQAPTHVVAGDVARDASTRPQRVTAAGVSLQCWPRAEYADAIPALPVPPVARRIETPVAPDEIVLTGQKIARESELGDYKLYSLPEPTTVAAHQTKQVLFLNQPGVAFTRIYAFRLEGLPEALDEGPRPTRVVLRLRNRVADGLGRPLPAGGVAVMTRDPRGRLILAGEDELDDVPVGELLEVETGRAVEVQAHSRLIARSGGGRRERAELAVEFSNAGAEPVRVEHRQARLGQSFRLVRASRRAEVRAGEPAWTLNVPAGGRVTLTYTIEYDR